MSVNCDIYEAMFPIGDVVLYFSLGYGRTRKGETDMTNGMKTLTEEERIKLRESFITIDNFIKEYLWQLDSKTPSRWVKVSNDIRDLVPLVSESGYKLTSPSDEELRKAQRRDSLDPFLSQLI